MKCQYRNCELYINIDKKFDELKKYCCLKHQRNEKKYRQRDKNRKNLNGNKVYQKKNN